MDSILELRPAGTTAADISAALSRAEAAAAEARQTVADAKERRDGLLLDGSSAQLATAEKLLAAAKDLVERIEAMQGQLRARLAVAERAEALAALAAAKEAAEAASAKKARWWTETEPQLRGAIIEGMRVKAAASAAYHAWNNLNTELARRYPDAVSILAPDAPRFSESPAPDWADDAIDALRGTMTREEAIAAERPAA